MSEDRSTWASNGFKIAPFGKGRNAIQSAHTNDLVDALNMLGTITVIRGTDDKVLYADNGVIIQLKSSAVEANSSITVSESDGTPSVSDVTEIKFPAGTVTDDGGGVVTIAAVAPVQMLRLKSIQADYLTCRTWDGTTEGSTDILVAKSYKLSTAPWTFFIHEMLHDLGLQGHSPKEPWVYGVLLNGNGLSSSMNTWDELVVDWLAADEVYCVDKNNLKTVDLQLASIDRQQAGLHSVMVKLDQYRVLIVESHKPGDFSPGMPQGVYGLTFANRRKYTIVF
jgi:hypothetical protein